MRSLVIVCVAVAAILAVSTAASAATCAETKYADMYAYMLLDWGAWSNANPLDAQDRDWDGISDPYMGALAAAAMCADPAIQAAYDANLAAADALIPDWWNGFWGWSVGDDTAPQLAAYAMWDPAWNMVMWFWYYYGDTGVFQLVPSLFATADYDGDGLTNQQEYDAVLAVGGGPLLFAQASTDPLNFWPGNPAMPVAGLVGLGLLAGACTIGGALSLRRKK